MGRNPKRHFPERGIAIFLNYMTVYGVTSATKTRNRIGTKKKFFKLIKKLTNRSGCAIFKKYQTWKASAEYFVKQMFGP